MFSSAWLEALLPEGWIKEAIASNGRGSLRTRRLPAERVAWLIVAQALFRDRSIPEVLEALDVAYRRSDEELPPVKSAITQAQYRLGEEPLESLFKTAAAAWSQEACAQNTWFGLSLWAMDGTTIKTPDTPANRSTFGAQVYDSGAVSSYPQVRLLSLMAVHSRLIKEVEFGNYNINEMRYAELIEERIPDDSLTLVDKGFFSAAILVRLMNGGVNRHFIIPARKHTRGVVIAGDYQDSVVRMTVSPMARKKHPDLPQFWELRSIPVALSDGRRLVLLTSLLDEEMYPREEILNVFRRRWEAETCFAEIKETLLGGKLTLRARSPRRVRQEIWGLLVAYNLIRLRMAQVAASTMLSPTAFSFTRARNLIRDRLLIEAGASRVAQPSTGFGQGIQQLVRLPHKKRLGRKCPREIKALPARYPERILRREPE